VKADYVVCMGTALYQIVQTLLKSMQQIWHETRKPEEEVKEEVQTEWKLIYLFN